MRIVASLVLVLGFAPTAAAGFLVLGNFTPAEVTFTVTQPGGQPQTVKLAAYQVAPVTVAGPADIQFPSTPAPTTLRLDPFNAYVFVPDDKAGRRLEGLELVGDPPERDARPELNPKPRDRVTIPVTLLVDDADLRAENFWQATLRKRFDEAAAVVAAHAPVKLELAGFGTWKSNPTAKDVPALLADFELKVPVKPGHLAIGYTSRKVEEKDDTPFGGVRGVPGKHVLLRELRPTSEGDRVEVLVRHLGMALGAVPLPDPGSVMRPKLADGRGITAKYGLRFDPLNTLALNLWADERRRDPAIGFDSIDPANVVRMTRVYKALLKASPGDPAALVYVNGLDRDIARAPEGKKNPDPGAAKNNPPGGPPPSAEAVRAVVRAVVARAKANVLPGTITNDDLTEALVKAAADAALGIPDQVQQVSAFLLGLSVALDDTGALADDPLTAAAVKDVETPAEREERLAVLGNPTVRYRRDLCRRFAIGLGTGDILPASRAEDAAVGRCLFDLHGPAGFGFPAVAAECAGAAFARAVREDPGLIKAVAEKPALVLARVPATSGLRDGLSVDRFEDDFGGPTDDRFRAVLADIRKRVKAAGEKK